MRGVFGDGAAPAGAGSGDCSRPVLPTINSPYTSLVESSCEGARSRDSCCTVVAACMVWEVGSGVRLLKINPLHGSATVRTGYELAFQLTPILLNSNHYVTHHMMRAPQDKVSRVWFTGEPFRNFTQSSHIPIIARI